MAVVEVFISPREDSMRDWADTVKELKQHGLNVRHDYAPADLSVVLSGQHENATLLDGRKVLFYDPDYWRREFSVYQFVLVEYYDDIVNLQGLDGKEKAERILKYIRTGE